MSAFVTLRRAERRICLQCPEQKTLEFRILTKLQHSDDNQIKSEHLYTAPKMVHGPTNRELQPIAGGLTSRHPPNAKRKNK